MPPFWYYTVEARSYALMFCVACGVIFLSSRKDARYKRYAVYLALIGVTVNFFGLYLIPVALLLGFSTDRSFYRNILVAVVLLARRGGRGALCSVPAGRTFGDKPWLLDT